MKKVKETDILIDNKNREKLKTVRTPENIAAVAESVREVSSTSIYRRSQQMNILETSLGRILRKEIGMTPYKVQLVQSPFASLIGAASDLQKMPILANKIIFSDQAHFHLGNKQNCRIWGTENPHVYIE